MLHVCDYQTAASSGASCHLLDAHPSPRLGHAGHDDLALDGPSLEADARQEVLVARQAQTLEVLEVSHTLVHEQCHASPVRVVLSVALGQVRRHVANAVREHRNCEGGEKR